MYRLEDLPDLPLYRPGIVLVVGRLLITKHDPGRRVEQVLGLCADQELPANLTTGAPILVSRLWLRGRNPQCRRRGGTYGPSPARGPRGPSRASAASSGDPGSR